MCPELLIVEEGLKNKSGHWYEYVRASKSLIEREKDLSVRIIGHAALEPSISDELDAQPVFRYTNWDGIYDSANPLIRYAGVIRHNFRLLADLNRHFKSCSNVRYVFAPTVVLHHLLGFYLFLLLNYRSRVSLILMIRNNIADYTCGDQPRFRGTARFWSVMLRFYKPLIMRGRVRFVTDSDQLAREIELLAGIEAQVIPHPSLVANPVEAPKVTNSQSEFSCWLPGPARYEKGSDLLMDALKTISERSRARTVRVIVQWQSDFLLPNGQYCKAEVPPGVDNVILEVIADPLTSTEYMDLMSNVDLIILPYRREAYFARISGVAVEALLLGKPILSTKNTWVERLLLRFSTGTFCEVDAQSIGDSVVVAIENIDQLNRSAITARSLAADYFSSASFVTALLGNE